MHKASQTLPDSYQLDNEFSMKNPRRMLWLNALGFGLVLFFFWLFSEIVAWLRPDLNMVFTLRADSLQSLVIQILAVIATVIFILVLHEGVHGLFFWLFTRQKPIFGIGLTYAYAGMPGWYFPRNMFLVIGAAPFVLISLLGVGLIAIIPPNLMTLLLIALVMNAAGAVGDLAAIAWLLTKPVSALAHDRGDSIEVFVSAHKASSLQKL